MRRDAQGAVLLLLGILLLRLTLGGSYVYYVKASMKPFLLLTAAVLLALAVWSLWQSWRRTEEHDDGHGHDGVPRVAWLMVLPVMVVFLVSPRPLGAFTAARQLATAPVVAEPAELLPLPAGDPVDVPIADYITRAVWGQGQTLEGREVRLTGFVTPDPEGGWWVTRLGLACCAADALSFRARVLDAEDLPANTWVEVTGRWVPGDSGDPAIPLIEADDVERVPEPRNPYE
ncbi:MAG: TIGR03943 family protein [Actinobacteria bacterium]|nr:TIGR03943 family protein [Actinomycetota bacterium]MCB0920830.1 TIGR03943 family protein [Actinomycetota bacterium]